MQQGHVLRRLCRQGNTELVSQMLDAGVAVDAPQEDGCTGLWLACEHGCTDVARLLLQRRANANAVKTAGNISALFISSQNGHASIVDLLLHHGANPNICKSSGASPLFIAAQQNHPEIVRSLLRAGANHSATTSNGVTPLMIAAFQGHMQVVRLLLAAGADPHAVGQGKNAIEWAAENRHREEMQAIVDEHLRHVQTEVRRKRAVEAYDTPLVARGQNSMADPDLSAINATPARTPGGGVGGATAAASQGRTHYDASPGLGGAGGGGASALHFSGYTPRYLTAPSLSQSGGAGMMGVAPTPASTSSYGHSGALTTGDSPRRHFNTRSFGEPLAPGVGAMQPVTGGVTPQLLVEEQRRSQAFRSLVKRESTAVRPPPAADWSTASVKHGLDRPLYTTEAQWHAHKERLAAQTHIAAEVSQSLSDSWMYSSQVTSAYSERQAALRQQAAQAERQNREQIEQSKRNATEAGFAFPRLAPEKMDALRQFMSVGRGASGPPPPLEPEVEMVKPPPPPTSSLASWSSAVAAIAEVASPSPVASPNSANKPMSAAEKLRARQAARGS